MPSPTRRPCSRAGLAIGAVALALLGAACSSPAPPPPAAPAPSAPALAPLPQSYQLTGDEGGSKFEGIGYDDASGTFYVSEITGGEVHRGRVDAPATAEWLAGAGTDGRFTARGITVDDAGRVYIAGGPNGIEHPDALDLWVYDRDGVLLAALDTGVDRAFLNDVAIGPDGAAYFTNSNAPQVFRVVADNGRWAVTTWADGTGTIGTQDGFNLGGIVASPDGAALLVAQGNVGKLWRFDLASRSVSEVATSGANLRDADGLVLQDDRLTAVRNMARALTTVRLNAEATAATPLGDQPTAPDRVLTSAKLAGDRLLVVDSMFDENPAQPPYEVLGLMLP